MTSGTAARPVSPPGIINARFVSIFMINMFSQYAVYSMNTLTGPFAGALGAAPTLIGVVSSLFALTAMMLKLVSSPTIDAVKRKWVLLLALGLLAAACGLYACAHSITVLVISRLLAGASMGFLTPVCFVIAADAIPKERMSTGMGYYTLGTVAVQAFAPVIGLKLSGMFGYNAAFAVVTAVVLATTAYAAIARFDTTTPPRPFSVRLDSIFSSAVLAPAFVLLVEAMVWCQVNAFLILFGATRGVKAEQMGLYFTVLAVVLVGSRPLIGHLADRFGSSRILQLCMGFLAASFLTISVAHALPMFLVGAALAAFGYAGCQPTLMAVCLRRVPHDRRGAASCTAYMGQDIGNLFGGALGGALAQGLGYAAMWRLMLVPLAGASLVIIRYRRQFDSTEVAGATPATS
ncbi:MAG TPA: MFS transporter [Caulobacteraceae bacterium]|nr:MFS transporter [Caulobacteraceae bacterium]